MLISQLEKIIESSLLEGKYICVVDNSEDTQAFWKNPLKVRDFYNCSDTCLRKNVCLYDLMWFIPIDSSTVKCMYLSDEDGQEVKRVVKKSNFDSCLAAFYDIFCNRMFLKRHSYHLYVSKDSSYSDMLLSDDHEINYLAERLALSNLKYLHSQ